MDVKGKLFAISLPGLHRFPIQILDELFKEFLLKIRSASAADEFFVNELSIGSVGEDVRRLQMFLNDVRCTVAPRGFGSPGNETDYFGSLTKKALERCQSRFSLPVTGVLDFATREYINIFLFSDGEVKYRIGDTHRDIREVQEFLNTTDCIVAEHGLGSAGRETDYFGLKTQNAVLCYRKEHDLMPIGTITEAMLTMIRNT